MDNPMTKSGMWTVWENRYAMAPMGYVLSDKSVKLYEGTVRAAAESALRHRALELGFSTEPDPTPAGGLSIFRYEPVGILMYTHSIVMNTARFRAANQLE